MERGFAGEPWLKATSLLLKPEHRAIGLNKTAAFESEEGDKAVSRGNQQLIQGFKQSMEVRKPKVEEGSVVHHEDCCFGSSQLSEMSLLCNLNSCWPSRILQF